MLRSSSRNSNESCKASSKSSYPLFLHGAGFLKTSFSFQWLFHRCAAGGWWDLRFGCVAIDSPPPLSLWFSTRNLSSRVSNSSQMRCRLPTTTTVWNCDCVCCRYIPKTKAGTGSRLRRKCSRFLLERVMVMDEWMYKARGGGKTPGRLICLSCLLVKLPPTARKLHFSFYGRRRSLGFSSVDSSLGVRLAY